MFPKGKAEKFHFQGTIKEKDGGIWPTWPCRLGRNELAENVQTAIASRKRLFFKKKALQAVLCLSGQNILFTN